MTVKEGLERVAAYDGVRLALLVGRDGLLIEGVSKNEEEDLENLGAVVSHLMTQAERAGGLSQQGALAQMVLDFEGGFLAVETLGEDFIVVGADHPAYIGLLRTAMKRHRDELIAAVQSY